MKELEALFDSFESPRQVEFRGCNQRVLDVLEVIDKRISKLEGGIVASADALADLEYRHLKRIEVLERDNPKYEEGLGDALDCTLLLDKRLTALEEKFERSLPSFEDVKGILKDKPLSCCEGCVEYPPCGCGDMWDGDAKHPPCYVEKHTCGECARAYRRDDSTRAICGSNYRWSDNSLDHECDSGDFEAIQ